LLQSLPPSEAEFGIDVDDIDPSAYRHLQVLIRRSRAAVQRQRNADRSLDIPDSFYFKMLLFLTGDHALAHAVRITDRWGEDIDSGRLDELLSFLCGRERRRLTRRIFVNLLTSPDIPDFALNHNRWAYRFENLHGFFSLACVLLQR